MAKRKKKEKRPTIADIARVTAEKKEQALALFKSAASNVSYTCDSMGITRKCWYDWRKEDEAFDAKVLEIEQRNIDFAESQMMRNIKAGKETSLIFFLLNRAPDRWKDKRNIEFGGSVKLIEVDK